MFLFADSGLRNLPAPLVILAFNPSAHEWDAASHDSPRNPARHSVSPPSSARALDTDRPLETSKKPTHFYDMTD